MLRLSQAIAAVIAGTIVSGVAGGLVSAVIGRLAPSFVTWIYDPSSPNLRANINEIEVALGLGVVRGLFFGAGACLFLAVVVVLRDAWLARAGVEPARDRKPLPVKM